MQQFKYIILYYIILYHIISYRNLVVLELLFIGYSDYKIMNVTED
jgi:hypothetical protein